MKWQVVQVNTLNPGFMQYVPKNMRRLVGSSQNLCLGAVHQGRACGAVICEKVQQELYIRYVFVDPSMRNKGCGTALIKGVLEKSKKKEITSVLAVYSEDMFDSRSHHHMGILLQAGMPKAKIFATGFQVQLGDIIVPQVKPKDEIKLYSAPEMTEELAQDFLEKANRGDFPVFADTRNTQYPIYELCIYATVRGAIVGVIVMEHRDDGLLVKGLSVLEEHQYQGVAVHLIGRALKDAKEIYPQDKIVYVSSITPEMDCICRKLFGKKSMVEMVEYLVEYFVH